MPDDTIRLDLPATHKYLHLLGSCIEGVLMRVDDLADAEKQIYNLQLAAQELCTNIVDHAYYGRDNTRIKVALSLEINPTQMVLEFWDTGRSFEPSAVPEPALGEPQVHGFGLFLVQQLVDDIEYRPMVGGNHWCLKKRLHRARKRSREIKP
jgi:serine/threonine-protein kinase RsbW